MSAADIHRQITEVYVTEAMSDSKVRKWARKFKEGRTNINDKERSVCPSVNNDDLMQAVETKIHENRRFTSERFPPFPVPQTHSWREAFQ
ncbi:HTH_48 domain-containing protein [Trichonephila clavipes]|nr:HTH_48 domain-containing protein [Trichonephila clavipes]